MPLRLLLDEHFSPALKLRLLRDGHDVEHVSHLGLNGDEDWDLVRYCLRHERVIVTKNRRHFEAEHAHTLARGDIHSGIVLCKDWSTEEVYRALRALLEDRNEDVLVNEVIALPPAE